MTLSITITSKQTLLSEDIRAGTVTLRYDHFKDGEPFGESVVVTRVVGEVTSSRGYSSELGYKTFRKKFVKLEDGTYGDVGLS